MTDSYIGGHLQEALAHEGETDVQVHVSGTRVLMTGTVATEARRDAVSAIAASVADGLEVHNQVTVLACTEPGEGVQEQLS